jgi:hypothetical protein
MEKQHSLGVTQLAILYNHQEFNYMILNSPGFIKFPLPNNTGHPYWCQSVTELKRDFPNQVYTTYKCSS